MEDDLQDEIEVLDKTWQKLTAKVHQEGFREGADEGRTKSFQLGFDQGYALGLDAAFTQACYNGALRTLKSISNPCPPDHLEEVASPDKAMCQICILPNQRPDSLAELKEWQKSVTNNEELVKKYEEINKVLGRDVVNTYRLIFIS
uniref:Essential protein Yae1 N-terminal domain-containing protein n=1 Tax=Cacopsylla melanoneura TaxID=428564 RepID=A0A8D8QHA8_9HEMI